MTRVVNYVGMVFESQDGQVVWVRWRLSALFWSLPLAEEEGTLCAATQRLGRRWSLSRRRMLMNWNAFRGLSM